MVIVYCICHEGTQRAVILALGFRNLCAEMGFPGGLDGKEFSCNAGNLDLIPGLRRFLGEGNSNPLQYSCLGNPVDRGAWRAAVHGVAKESDTTEHAGGLWQDHRRMPVVGAVLLLLVICVVPFLE